MLGFSYHNIIRFHRLGCISSVTICDINVCRAQNHVVSAHKGEKYLSGIVVNIFNVRHSSRGGNLYTVGNSRAT